MSPPYPMNDEQLVIGLVGPCTSGKSLLKDALHKRDYQVRHIAQEHSFMKDMWQRYVAPDVLIFLDVSYPITLKRRNMDWTEKDYEEQQRRLEHARKHADFYLDTDNISPGEVLKNTLVFLRTA
ncbi:MAG: hypothetical protein ACE5GO_05955 [Anaerolineales bacterium]